MCGGKIALARVTPEEIQIRPGANFHSRYFQGVALHLAGRSGPESLISGLHADSCTFSTTLPSVLCHITYFFSSLRVLLNPSFAEPLAIYSLRPCQKSCGHLSRRTFLSTYPEAGAVCATSESSHEVRGRRTAVERPTSPGEVRLRRRIDRIRIADAGMQPRPHLAIHCKAA